LTWARDSNRISQMVKLSDSLQVYSATKSLPLPDNYVEIHASWSVIAYQWEVGVDVLETIDYTNGGTDPKDDSYYTYYLTKDRKSIQLMALMEEQSLSANTNPLDILQDAHAADYEDRFAKVYGRKLWTLTQETTNTPIQQLSTFSSTPFEITTETGYTAHISDTEKIVWTVAWDLQASIKNGSCKRIKQTWWSRWNGTYTINPGWSWDIKVYCDMETWWGAWIKYFTNKSEIVWIYNFDENLKDYSGNDLDGSISVGGITYSDDSIYWEGQLSAQVQTSSNSISDISTSFTYSVWIKRTETSSYQWPILLGNWNDAHGCFGLRANNYGANVYFEYSTWIWTWTWWSATSLDENQWTNFIITFDGTNIVNYKNWEVFYSANIWNIYLESSCDFLVFWRNFRWNLDNTRIYNIALTDSQVNALYQEWR
jgi:hypothetical protein